MVNDTSDSPDIVAQTFARIEADTADSGFSAAVDSRLTWRLRIRRAVLSIASLLGMGLFIEQLHAGRYLFAELPAPLTNIGSHAVGLPGIGWLASLILALAVTAVTCSTLFSVVLALRGHSSA